MLIPAAACLAIGMVLWIFYVVFPGEWRVKHEVNKAIKECLPSIELFMEKNRALLDEAVFCWEESEFRLSVEYPTNKLYYSIPPVDHEGAVDNTSEIPQELLRIFEQIEGSETEWVTAALVPDGISLGWGFRTYVDIEIFHSDGIKNQWYSEGPTGFDLGGGWYAVFLGALRG